MTPESLALLCLVGLPLLVFMYVGVYFAGKQAAIDKRPRCRLPHCRGDERPADYCDLGMCGTHCDMNCKCLADLVAEARSTRAEVKRRLSS